MLCLPAHALADEKAESAQPSSLSIVVHLRGEILALDYAAGLARLSASGTTVSIHARPEQLAPCAPGQIVDWEVGNYDGERWLALPADPQSGDAGTAAAGFARSGSIVGSVQEVDRRAGVLVIDSIRFRAHPEQLRGTLPGAFVQVDYFLVGAARWASHLGPWTTGDALVDIAKHCIEQGRAQANGQR